MKKIFKNLGINTQRQNGENTQKVGNSKKIEAKAYSQIHTSNVYDETQNVSNLSKIYEDAENSLQHRTYAERSKPKMLIMNAFRYSYPLISLLFAVCAVWLIAMYATEDISSEYIKNVQFVGVFLIGVFGAIITEVLKSYFSNEVFKYKVQSNVILLILCTLSSIIYTSAGSYLLSLHLTDKTEILTNEAIIQSDSIKNQYAEQIALLKSQINKDNEVLKKYKAGDYRAHFASERLSQNTPKLNDFLQLQKQDLESLSKEKEKKIHSSFTKNHAFSIWSVFFVLLAEIGYIFTIRAIIQTQKKIKTENRNHNIVQPKEPVQLESPEKITLESLAIQMLINQIQGGQLVQFQPIQSQNAPQKFGFQFSKNTPQGKINPKNSENNDPRLDDLRETSRVGSGNRTCKNCGKLFTYNSPNHQYCSEKCRIQNWEKRTGKTFKKIKK